MLRLNVAIPPSSSPNNLGVVGGDAGRVPRTGAGSTTTW